MKGLHRLEVGGHFFGFITLTCPCNVPFDPRLRGTLRFSDFMSAGSSKSSPHGREYPHRGWPRVEKLGPHLQLTQPGQILHIAWGFSPRINGKHQLIRVQASAQSPLHYRAHKSMCRSSAQGFSSIVLPVSTSGSGLTLSNCNRYLFLES